MTGHFPAYKRPLAEVGYKNVPDSKTAVLRTKFPLPIECEARYGGTPLAEEFIVAVQISLLAVVRSCAGIENTRHCGVPPSVLRTRQLPMRSASEGRLAAGYTDGGFQPPVKSSNETCTRNKLLLYSCKRSIGFLGR